MYEQQQIEERIRAMPLQMKSEETVRAAKKSRRGNPYEGTPLQVSGRLAGHIKQSFGINANELAMRESPEVAEMGARATAQGNAIRFAPGEFRPDTREGMAVLGHELNHVREQATGGVHAPGGEVFEHPHHEAASDRAGESFASGTLSAAAPVSVGGMNAGAAPVQGDFFGFKNKKQRVKHLKELRHAEIARNYKRVGRKTAKESITGANNMQQHMLSGGYGAGGAYMQELYNSEMIPNMQAATTGWENKTESENILNALVSSLRGSTEFNAANSEMATQVFEPANRAGIGVADRIYSARSQAGAGNMQKDSAEAQDALLQVLEVFKEDVGQNNQAKAMFSDMNAALSEVDFFKQNSGARDRSNLNNIALRAINPSIRNRTSGRLGTEKDGRNLAIPKELEPSEEQDKAISGLLQKSLNTYTQHGNQSTEEKRDPLHDMFDSIISAFKTPMTERATATPSDAAPAAVPARDGPTYGPLTQSQQATMDKWDAPAPAAAPKKSVFKRMLNKIRGRS